MNKLFTLIRVQFKDNMSRYAQQLNVKGKWLGKLVMLLPLLVLLPTVQIILFIAKGFNAIGHPELTITYVYIATVVLLFFTALPLVVSIFFYSRDLSLLATLPVKDESIFFSKLASVFFYLLVFTVPILGSALAIYLHQSGFNIATLLLGIAAIILTPLAPMILAAVLVLPFMSLAGGAKNRNLLIILGNLLILGVVIGLEVLISRTATSPESIIQYLTQKDGLLNLIGSSFPPSIWLTKMLEGSLPDLLWFLLLNLALLTIIRLLSPFIYKKALQKYNQQSGGTSSSKVRFKKSNLRFLLLKRHLGIIFSNPAFMLNSVMTIFVPVLIFAIYNLAGIMDLSTLTNPLLDPYRLLIYTGIILSPSIIGSLSATSISREGKTFWETKVLPISDRENLKARMNTTLLLTGIGQIIIAGLALVVLPLKWWQLPIAFFVAAGGTFLMSAIDLIINISRPMLNWTNPTAAVKNNLNVMLSLASRVILGIIVFAIYKLTGVLSQEYLLIVIGFFFFFSYLIARWLMYRRYIEKYSRIEF